ncbi:MAG: helix-turn-helix transcriptional regulator, partial [Tissierellales bacterium]
MKKRCRNIYRIARKSAGYTQEEAAELLHVSPRSLSDYEQGKTIPPDDVVCKMVEIYGARWLGYEHLRQS